MLIQNLDEKGVLEITFDRPDLHNAFNEEMIQKITDIFKNIPSQNIRLVVLKANGPSFSAGADLNWMKSMSTYSFGENQKDALRLDSMFESISSCHVPVLAQVQGHVLGGGMGILACCDYVLACEKTQFGFSEVLLGLVPAVISPYVIKKIGPSQAKAFFLSGIRFDSKKACAMGLVHQVCEPSTWKSEFENVVNSFLKAAPLAQKECKKLIDSSLLLEGQNEKLKLMTTSMIANLRVSSEGQEGMNALLEKRRPVWK